MRRAVGVTSVVVGLGLGLGGGLPAAPVSAQTGVMVPIVIRQPGAAVSAPARTSVQVTTRTVSPQPGVTQTHVTIRDTTGVAGYASGRPQSTEPGVTRVTIQDTTGVAGYASGRPLSTEPGVTRTHVTIQDTTGINGFSSRTLGWNRAGIPQPVGGPPGPLRPPTVDDGPTVIVPFPVTLRPGPQSLTITTNAPIDTPIVILGP
jgi:hypothetical protein